MKLQFRLRTLMIVVTLLAVPLGYVGWQAKIVRERKALANSENFAGWSNYPSGGNVAWVRQMLGDCEYTHITLWRSVFDESIEKYRTVFPEAQIDRYEFDRDGT